jgi:glycosyltransferase involved in cell wall biosynthesis
MNIWLQYVTKVIVVAPLENGNVNQIHLAYQHPNIEFITIHSFDITNFKSVFYTIFKLPKITYQIIKASYKANHIHLRCPGNVGLLGCMVQVFFPKKLKTAKYAGNWDPKNKNPWSYKLQKYILNNTFLTRNMKVLVYGHWENQSKNIKPFFTASYFESDKIAIKPRNFSNVIKIIFVGTLSPGKRPLYAIQLIEKLLKNGLKVELMLFGEGNHREVLEDYIADNKLCKNIFIKGNQNADTIKNAYQESHFVILPSESEGWPKAIAEGMFWGCVPVATKVSCVPFMLDNGHRGILLDMNLDSDANNLLELIKNQEKYLLMSKKGQDWSRKYTLDYFEEEIQLLLQQ